jgi:hypothetical protein
MQRVQRMKNRGEEAIQNWRAVFSVGCSLRRCRVDISKRVEMSTLTQQDPGVDIFE